MSMLTSHDSSSTLMARARPRHLKGYVPVTAAPACVDYWHYSRLLGMGVAVQGPRVQDARHRSAVNWQTSANVNTYPILYLKHSIMTDL